MQGLKKQVADKVRSLATEQAEYMERRAVESLFNVVPGEWESYNNTTFIRNDYVYLRGNRRGLIQYQSPAKKAAQETAKTIFDPGFIDQETGEFFERAKASRNGLDLVWLHDQLTWLEENRAAWKDRIEAHQRRRGIQPSRPKLVKRAAFNAVFAQAAA